MQNIRNMRALVGAGAVIFALAGCADKNGNGQAESPANVNNVGGAVKDNIGDTGNVVVGGVEAAGNAVAGAADSVAGAASGAAGAVGNAASGAAGAVKNAGGAMAGAGMAAVLTPKIKTALGANPGLKGSKINVDTLPEKNSIALRGTVTSAAQKALANAIAKKGAPGYKVVDQLKMSK